MKLVKPSYEILFVSPEPLKLIEQAGRTCYKSEEKITEGSAEKFARMLKKVGHLSVIEHCHMTVRIICDRGITHEIVRHRLASYSQESTRWCSYEKEVSFIIPHWLALEEGKWAAIGSSVLPISDVSLLNAIEEYGSDESGAQTWLHSMLDAETSYITLVKKKGWSPERARGVLTTHVKTEIVMTANFREWSEVIFKLRTSGRAHSQIQEIMKPLQAEMRTLVPVIFD